MHEEAVEVSVVFPCLNEEATIGMSVRAARQALEDAAIRGEVIVADNDSMDRSREIALEEGARIVDVRRPGYGNALRAGLRAAHGRFLIFLDADMSYDCGDIAAFVAGLDKGADVVIGSRLRGRIDPGAMPRLHRRVGTPILTSLANGLFGCGISDINCGMRGLTHEALDRLDLYSEGMEFASEMMIRAAQAKLRVTEIPISFHVDQRGRIPHLRSFRDGWRHLQLMMHFCSIWLFLLPGWMLTLGGFGAMFARIDPPVGLVTGLAGLCSALLGIQVLLLGLAAQGRAKTSKYALYRKRIPRVVRNWLRVDKGVVLGAVVAAVGGATLGYAAWRIAQRLGPQGQAFPPLEWALPRLALLGAALLLVGLQVFFASLFLGLFGIRVAEDEPQSDSRDADAD